MRLAKTTTLIACLAALLLGGCGSSNDTSKQIPASTRQELDKQLQSVENRFDAGDGACTDIAQNQNSVQRTLDSLPAGVDSDVKNALRDGFDRLFHLTAEQCDEKKNQQTDTQPTETTPAPAPQPETTPTAPTQTETTPTSPQAQPKKPKENKKQSGNGGAGNSVPQAGKGDGAGGTVSP
jgi:hypothetical protein